MVHTSNTDYGYCNGTAILFLPKIPSDIASLSDILFLRTGCIAPTTLNDFDVLISCAEEVLVVSGP